MLFDEEKRWLDSLKPGDEVLVVGSAWGSMNGIGIVRSISPKRTKFEVEQAIGIRDFNKHGELSGATGFQRPRLARLTEEARSAIKLAQTRQRLEERLLKANGWLKEDLSLETCEKLLAALEK